MVVSDAARHMAWKLFFIQLRQKKDVKGGNVKRLVTVLGVLSWICFAGPASAAVVSTSLNISAAIGGTCTAATSPVNFGTVVPGTTVNVTGGVDSTCTNGMPYKIALDGGANFVATGSVSRQLKSTTASVYYAYELYKDSNHTLIWGNSDTGGSYLNGTSLADTGNGLTQSHAVYASFTPSFGSFIDTYADIVNVYVVY